MNKALRDFLKLTKVQLNETLEIGKQTLKRTKQGVKLDISKVWQMIIDCFLATPRDQLPNTLKVKITLDGRPIGKKRLQVVVGIVDVNSTKIKATCAILGLQEKDVSK